MKTTETIQAGDVEGHEFHGNQWTDGASRFDSYGDGNTPDTNGKHVTEFENDDLNKKELQQKAAAHDEGGEAELARKARGDLRLKSISVNADKATEVWKSGGKKFTDNDAAMNAHEKAAQLHEAAGNKEQAAKHNKAFFMHAENTRESLQQKGYRGDALKSTDKDNMKKLISTIVKASAPDVKMTPAQAEGQLLAALGGDTAAQEKICAMTKETWEDVVVMAGDVPGHEFHGNQYTEESVMVASELAHNASEDAKEEEKFGDPNEATRLHAEAYKAHIHAETVARITGNQMKPSAKRNQIIRLAEKHASAARNHVGVKVTGSDKTVSEVIKAAGNSEGNAAGNATRKSAAAATASEAAHAASAKATGEDCEDGDCEAAADAHDEASDAHKKAMLAHSKCGSGDKACEHAKAMVAHDAMRDAHKSDEPEAAVAATMKQFFADKVVVKAEAKPDADKNVVTATARDIVRCRASGSKLPESVPWVKDQQVKFCHMPGGLHTITAGFSGPITKGRNGSINLTVDVDPDRDAPVCQASMEEIKKDSPKQDLFGCYEHDEQKASVWVDAFEAGTDPIHGEPCILLAARPSGDGAKDVNDKNWRSWSPSFGTDAEYGKCKCRGCSENIKVCACTKPAFYFPEGVRGSLSNPAHITGVDGVVGTLTNKPAFRAMPPVRARAREQECTVTAGAPMGNRNAAKDGADEGSSFEERKTKAWSETSKANEWSKKAEENGKPTNHQEAMEAHRHASASHFAAAHKATDAQAKLDHENLAVHHMEKGNAHEAKMLSADMVKSTAADQLDADTILASMPAPLTIDKILAGMTGYRSAAAELDAEEDILKACSGVT